MPRSPSRYDKDRRDRDRDRHRSQKDHSSEVSKMKEKMRHNLETARSSGISDFSNFSAQKSQKYEEMTPAEHLARTKAIEEIEEGGFQVGTFKSGTTAKKDQKSKKETSHDAAIFGPAWKSAEQRKAIEKKESDISTITLPTAPTPPMNSMAPMVPSHMNSEHMTTRKAEWKAYWSTLRHQLITENY
ncbi:hypothetical protein GCK72_015412 [Caenorhabditis remanei]|uniref:Uncharacterized protein n=1 Tax=Caenorhabditis remanei TaxID=31234 RepID=A0A6A5GX71_CAERE|nr:hypothetical protein GCK72_015412 [Caenorhabditis remanei]KAF1758952.1 hypothetical protein GCK72_015412 [Caenorhabditis remanei]